MAVIRNIIVKNLREYLYFNLYRKYTFTILEIRALFLRAIIETIILYIYRILRYII